MKIILLATSFALVCASQVGVRAGDYVGGTYVPGPDQFEYVQPGLDDIRMRALIFAMAELCRTLRDCESARFRIDVVHRLGRPTADSIRDDDKNGYSVCGEVNAKSAFGGYVGWQKFVFATAWWDRYDIWNNNQQDGAGNMLTIEQEFIHDDDAAGSDPPSIMQHSWRKFCW